MNMHNPPHSCEFICDVYMAPYNLSCRALAIHLGVVAASTPSRIVKCQSTVTPEMALRLSKVNTEAVRFVVATFLPMNILSRIGLFYVGIESLLVTVEKGQADPSWWFSSLRAFSLRKFISGVIRQFLKGIILAVDCSLCQLSSLMYRNLGLRPY